MFKRPPYISIMVGFSSIFCVIMVFAYLKIVFITGAPEDAPPTPVAQTPAAQAKAQADAEAAAEAKANEIIPASAMPLIGLVYSIIAFICTVNMLDGANWARWLYTVTFLLILICYILVYSNHFISVVPVLFLRGIVIPFLFLPAANDFFKTEH